MYEWGDNPYQALTIITPTRNVEYQAASLKVVNFEVSTTFCKTPKASQLVLFEHRTVGQASICD